MNWNKAMEILQREIEQRNIEKESLTAWCVRSLMIESDFLREYKDLYRAFFHQLKHSSNNWARNLPSYLFEKRSLPTNTANRKY